MTRAQFEAAIEAADSAANEAWSEIAEKLSSHQRPCTCQTITGGCPHCLDCQEIAAQAYADHLPILADRRAAQLFIALVVRGVARGWMDPKDARQHLYSAQLALSAFSMLGVSADPTPTDLQTASPGWYGARKASR